MAGKRCVLKYHPIQSIPIKLSGETSLAYVRPLSEPETFKEPIPRCSLCSLAESIPGLRERLQIRALTAGT
jgi:hypothetical protein